MAKFGFLGTKAKPNEAEIAAAAQIALAHATPAGGPTMTWSKDVVTRLSTLRNRLHQHLTLTSRDYTILTSIKSSKIEYCDTVTRELMRRLAGNPYFEVLQHLDDAQAQMGRTVLGCGR